MYNVEKKKGVSGDMIFLRGTLYVGYTSDFQLDFFSWRAG